MFNKILIANRGEIAVRIIRACKELGIATVAVFSEADRLALHTQLADEAVCIGGNKAGESYLNMQNILSAAFLTKSQAIHPGFGFLSENSLFASMCGDCNIKFIGPDPETIVSMGNKANARSLMQKAGVPVIPGSDGVVADVDAARAFAQKFGYPVMIKASAGGGGKGIRIVDKEEALESNFLAAQSEAKAAFSDSSLYMEKVIAPAKHIEVQILADEFGNIIHLGERDCSLQRRNQKVLEEAPCVSISSEKREELYKAAIKAAKACNYKNAGTVEFLFDKEQNFYFCEMNTRIQVEHPITEMITGIDIVKEQLKIASGIPMTIKQKDVKLNGHAIECRINAENPKKGFAPSPGNISYLFLPGGGLGVRVDSAIYAGYTIPPYYDSMLAKIIAHGSTREDAIAKMKRALSELVVSGIDTNIDFQMEILNNESFLQADMNTKSVSSWFNYY